MLVPDIVQYVYVPCSIQKDLNQNVVIFFNSLISDQGYVHIEPMNRIDRIEVRKGTEKVRIAYILKSYPQATYTWLKDDKEILQANPLYKFRSPNQLDSDMAVLKLIDVKEEHSGKYTLVGRLGDLVTSKSMEVVVFGKTYLIFSHISLSKCRFRK